MFKNIYLKATLLSSILLFIACDKDDAPEAENEMEVFTAAVIVVTNLFDNSSVIYEFEVEGHEHEDHEEHGVLNGSLIQNQEEDDGHGDHIEIELESYTDYKFEISFINESDPDNPIDLTTEVSEEAAEGAHQDFIKRFQKNALPDEIPEVTVTIAEDTVFITNLLKEANLVASTSEAMRMIKQGAVKINGEEKVTDTKLEVAKGTTQIYQVGKRKFAKITLA